jgi:hypothetical protein
MSENKVPRRIFESDEDKGKIIMQSQIIKAFMSTPPCCYRVQIEDEESRQRTDNKKSFINLMRRQRRV